MHKTTLGYVSGECSGGRGGGGRVLCRVRHCSVGGLVRKEGGVREGMAENGK